MTKRTVLALALLTASSPALATEAGPLASPVDVEVAASKGPMFTRESLRNSFCGDEDVVFKRSGIRGEIYFLVHVAANSRVDELRISRSSGTPRLDAAMAVCLLRNTFTAVIQDGKPVDSWRQIRSVYKPN